MMTREAGPIRRLTDEDYRRTTDELVRQGKADVVDPASVIPDVVNLDGLRQLEAASGGAQSVPPDVMHALALAIANSDDGEPDTFVFRGVRYRGRDLSHAEGARLQAIRLEIERLRHAAVATHDEAVAREFRLAQLYAVCAVCFYRWARPVRLIHRLLYRILPNPFERMTPVDMGRLLAFFSMCRMRSDVGGLPAAVQGGIGG